MICKNCLLGSSQISNPIQSPFIYGCQSNTAFLHHDSERYTKNEGMSKSCHRIVNKLSPIDNFRVVRGCILLIAVKLRQSAGTMVILQIKYQ